MAILEKQTNHYYKIDFDNCSVRGRKVFVRFSAYASISDREKEKVRREEWAKFNQALREKVDGDYKGLLQAVETQVATLEKAETTGKIKSATKVEIPEYLNDLPIAEQKLAKAVSMDESGKIDAKKFPNLREMQDRIHELSDYENIIPNIVYEFGEFKNEIEIPKQTETQLIELGFDPAWISDPVRITAGSEICVGDYNDEKIDEEFYYNRLKEFMSDDIADC